jgi:tetratricopeptide (TPR) repeat protein
MVPVLMCFKSMTKLRVVLPMLLLGLISEPAIGCELPSDLEHVPDLPSFGQLELEPGLCNRLSNTLLAADFQLGKSKSDSQRVRNIGNLARRLYGFGFVAQARALFETIRILDPDFYVAAWMLAVVEYENGGRRTLELAEAALALNPDHPPIQALISRLLLDRGDLEGARAFATRAVEANPDLAYARWTLGEIALRSGEAEEALEQISLALQTAREADLLYGLRAEALTQLSRHSEATAARGLVGGHEPQLTGAWISTLREVPFNPLPDLSFARASMRREHFAVALAVLERAHANDPSDSETARLLGVCQRRMGQREAALRSFRLATQLQGRYETWSDLARALQESEDFESASVAYRSALEFRPGDKLARFWLAECLVQLGELKSALALVEKLLGEGFGWQGYILASDIESRQGHEGRARELLQRGLRRFPGNAKLQAALAKQGGSS